MLLQGPFNPSTGQSGTMRVFEAVLERWRGSRYEGTLRVGRVGGPGRPEGMWHAQGRRVPTCPRTQLMGAALGSTLCFISTGVAFRACRLWSALGDDSVVIRRLARLAICSMWLRRRLPTRALLRREDDRYFQDRRSRPPLPTDALDASSSLEDICSRTSQR